LHASSERIANFKRKNNHSVLQPQRPEITGTRRQHRQPSAGDARYELQQPCLTSKSPKTLSSPPTKNIPLNLSGKSTLPARSVSPDERGRIAIVTNARWDAVDVTAANDERRHRGR
jgi:hypothetical protein